MSQPNVTSLPASHPSVAEMDPERREPWLAALEADSAETFARYRDGDQLAFALRSNVATATAS
jgi:hypothetical protein